MYLQNGAGERCVLAMGLRMLDFARTKRALDECPFCWQDDGGTPPRATIVSSGSCVYLAMPDREPLIEGHCWIVPMHHHVSSLDVDEEGWTEIRVS